MSKAQRQQQKEVTSMPIPFLVGFGLTLGILEAADRD